MTDWVAWLICAESNLEQPDVSVHPELSMEELRRRLLKMLAQNILDDPKNRTRPNPRYLYNEEFGNPNPISHYLDAVHFFNSAYYGSEWGRVFTEIGGIGMELWQGFCTRWDRHSSFSPEDLASNAAGAKWGASLDLSQPLAPQLLEYLEAIQAWEAREENDVTETDGAEAQTCDSDFCERMTIHWEDEDTGRSGEVYGYPGEQPLPEGMPGYEDLPLRDNASPFWTYSEREDRKRARAVDYAIWF